MHDLNSLICSKEFQNSRLNIGIDLGTTASAVAFSFKNQAFCIPIDNGHKTTPSIVNYDGKAVGREALLLNPKASVYSVKRHMSDAKYRFLNRSPAMISADILGYLKRQAQIFLSRNINEAVITVPAHFSDFERMETKKAASLAGIKVLRLLSEPTAASMAFGLDSEDGVYGVYDFGGGTFDFSVLRISNGIFQVLATGGDVYLGGDDIDIDILKYNLDRLNIPIESVDERDRLLAKLVCKSLKENLKDQNLISKKCLINEHEYDFSLSEHILERIISRYTLRTFYIVDQVIYEAKMSARELNGIVLVGGMTKLDLLRKKISEKYNLRIFSDINPDEVVALGASICAESILSKNNHSLLIDVVPLTLGIETFGGGVDKVIYRNTPIPITEEREYTTYVDGQEGVVFNIVQGERSLAKDCMSLGKFELKGLTKRRAGALTVRVEFSIDVNGLLSVSAYEKESQNISEITIETPELSEDKVLSALEDAFRYQQEDIEISREIIVCLETERILKFWRIVLEKFKILDKDIDDEFLGDISLKFERLSRFLGERNVEEILNLKAQLEKIMGPIVEKIIDLQLSSSDIALS